jgi:cobalt/nickel transport system permease protein
MHIEPGLIAQPKLLMAAAAATALLAAYLPRLLRQPVLILRTVLAAAAFTVFMQAFHMPVGPSELHFLGAMPLYLSFGFVPTLLGMALGLLLQGLLFEPQDLVNLAVNSLSLMLPLMAVHHLLAPRLLATGRAVTLTTLLKLDSAFYSGVVAMVGFWLAIGEPALAMTDWAHFAASYLPVVALEPLLTLGVLWLLRPQGVLHGRAWAAWCFEPRSGARAG